MSANAFMICEVRSVDALIAPLVLGPSVDRRVWTLEASEVYTMCSFYKLINFGGLLPLSGKKSEKSQSLPGSWFYMVGFSQ